MSDPTTPARRRRPASRPDPVPPPPWSPGGMVAIGLLLDIVAGGLVTLVYDLTRGHGPDPVAPTRVQAVAALVVGIAAALLLRTGRRTPRLIAAGLLIGLPFVLATLEIAFLLASYGDG